MEFNEVLFAAIVVFGVCGGVVIEALFKGLMPVIADSIRRRHSHAVSDHELRAELIELRSRLKQLEAK